MLDRPPDSTAAETAARSGATTGAPAAAPGSPRRPAWLWPAVATLLVMLAIGAFWSQRLGSTFAFSYDEGVYLTSAREVLHGEPLGSAVFSSQPPGLVDAVAAAFRLFGDTKAVGRGLMLAFGLVGLAVAALLAALLAGRWAAPFAAAGLGLSGPGFHAARTVEAEGPAIVLAVAALALLLLSVRVRARAGARVGGSPSAVPRTAWILLVLAGVAWGWALSMKLLPAIWGIPLLALCAVDPDPGGGWRLARPGAAVVRTLVLGSVSLAALALTVVGHSWSGVWDQAVVFHVKATDVFPAQTLGNLRQVRDTLLDHGALVALALGGVVGLWRRSRAAALWLTAWFVLSAAMLVGHNPLFSHHLVLLVPPLAVAAGCGGALAVAAGRGLAGPFTATAVALLLFGSPIRDQLQHLGKPASRENAAVVELIAAHSGPGDVVVSDEQMQVFDSGRRTAPVLTDTSVVRIRSGYLGGPEAISASEPAQVIVFWRDRLSDLPGYADWVKKHFRKIRSFGGKRAVWVRKSATP